MVAKKGKKVESLQLEIFTFTLIVSVGNMLAVSDSLYRHFITSPFVKCNVPGHFIGLIRCLYSIRRPAIRKRPKAHDDISQQLLLRQTGMLRVRYNIVLPHVQCPAEKGSSNITSFAIDISATYSHSSSQRKRISN